MNNIVLLHGALGAASDLEPLAQALKKSGLSPFVFSFSGHGGVPFRLEFNSEQLASELETFLLENHLEKVPVFGYSMGGFVALLLASRRSDLIGKIITLGTKFDWSKETLEKETKLLDPKKILEKVPAFAAALEVKHGKSWKELVLKTAGLMRGIHEKKLLDQDSLKKLQLPVLLGLGDKDQMVTVEETRAVFHHLPDAAMFMLPHTKHQIETANVELLSRILLDFIK